VTNRRARVVVLGGGVAGMSAAHELAERGFEVVVLERRDIAGGKARSIPVAIDRDGASAHMLADTGVAAIAHQLPGEHGFRFFPGFYKHVVDTMRRIPSFDGRQVADHLVPTTRIAITQYGQPAFAMPALFPRTPGDAGTVLRDILAAFSPVTGLTPDDLAHFGARVWQVMTSCDERRLGEYEGIDWWDFIGAAPRSPAYQKFLAAGITRSLVAAKARKASTRTIGDILVQLLMTMVTPSAGSSDRVLDGPTNLVWIDPWRSFLESRGVEYRCRAPIEEILCDGRHVTGVAIREQGRRRVVTGDYYVAAIPLERMAPLVRPALLAADPSLANLHALAPNVEWMTGVQYYLRRDVPTTHGHVIHIDSEWALTSISQLQFWRSVAPAQFGDSDVRGILSVDVSDWTAPGSGGRSAMHCSREEVVRETWRQLQRSINTEQTLLRDEDLHSWFLDPDIKDDTANPGLLRNSEPLLVNLVGTWALRPEAVTAIPNLFLASDYVRTHTDLATMEGANEAARRAVNGILDAGGFDLPRCAVWPLHQLDALAPWRLHDAARWKAGLPWDSSLTAIAARALGGASPVLDQVGPLLERAAPFIRTAADVLDLADGRLEDVSEVRAIDPTVAPGSAYVADGTDVRLLIADAVPAAAAIVGPAGFLDRLTWYRELLTDTLLSGVPAGEPRRHLYDPVRAFLGRSGKGLRPALCIATARALGGRTEDALPAAAGLEMLHNAFLVHDDIEDSSDSRRGAPTLHRIEGVPLAVNTGDAMNALAARLFRGSLDRVGPQATHRILEEVDHLVIETLEGQALELGWIRDNDLTVGPEDYLRLVLKKTAWYSFIHPLRIGALVADGGDADLARFDRFGYLLGLAFQITDDVLNLNGTVARYGKEIGGDLWEGKRTLVLAHALQHVGAGERSWIERFLTEPRERRAAGDVGRLRGLLESAGSIDWAARSARAFADAAAREFEGMAFRGVPAGPDLDWLRSCVAFVVSRDA
jgi:geranylgeranyl pyrophosphate synthase/uncharacterized protein with NAD-binding domain and iron-sulfur cluster